MTIGTLAALADLDNGGPVMTGMQDAPIAVATGGVRTSPYSELRLRDDDAVLSGVQQQAFEKMLNHYNKPLVEAMADFAEVLDQISPQAKDRVVPILEWSAAAAKALREFGAKLVAARAPATTWNNFVSRVMKYWPPVVGAVIGELKIAKMDVPAVALSIPAFEAYHAAGLPGGRPPKLSPVDPSAPKTSWLPMAIGLGFLGGAIWITTRP